MLKKRNKNETANENVSKDRSAFMHSKYEQSPRLLLLCRSKTLALKERSGAINYVVLYIFFRQVYTVGWFVFCFLP